MTGVFTRATVLALALTCAACAATGRYTWVDGYEAPPGGVADAYLIGPGDLLSVRVVNHDEMSARVRVRPDGQVSLPFLNDVQVAGQPPPALAQALTERLRPFAANPVVTVTVEEPRPFTVSVLGEVPRPGVYTLEPGAGVLQALASAGGLNQYAHDDRIFVLRRRTPSEEPERIRFDYRALTRAEGKAAGFRLRTHDVVVVE